MLRPGIESEKALEKKFSKAVSLNGGLSIKLIASLFNGLPDRLCLLPGGVLFFVEFKTTGLKPTKLQEKVHKMIRALDFKVFVVDKSEDIKQIMRQYESRDL